MATSVCGNSFAAKASPGWISRNNANNPYNCTGSRFIIIPEKSPTTPSSLNMDQVSNKAYLADKTIEGYQTAINTFNMFVKDTNSQLYDELNSGFIENYETVLETYTRWLLNLKKENNKYYQPKTLKQYYSGFNNCIANDKRFKDLLKNTDMSWLEGKTDTLEMRAWTASVERGESSVNSITAIRRTVASDFIKWYLSNLSNRGIEKDPSDVWQNW